MSRFILQMIMDWHEQYGILARRPFPPVNLQTAYSQLGGLPDLVSSESWPRASDGTPLHFLARIDCSELPEARGHLPSTGILQFFARVDGDMDWGNDSTAHSRVLYNEFRTGRTTSPPSDLPPIEGGWHRYDREMRLPTEPERKHYPNWPLVFDSIRTWPLLPYDPSLAVKSADFYVEVDRARAAEIVRATGYSTKALLGPRWGHLAFDKNGNREVVLPGRPLRSSAFPQAWILIERISRSLARLAHDEKAKIVSSQGGSPTKSGADPIGLLEDFDRVHQLAISWIERAKVSGLDEPTTEAVATEFMDWLRPLSADCRWEIQLLVMRSVERGMSAAVKYCGGSSKAASLVPVVYMNCLEDEHLLTSVDSFGIEVDAPRRSIRTAHHQLLGHAPAPNGSGPGSANDVLLLHLVSDGGVDFMFCDCGEIQFWMDAHDLIAKRFDRVRANTQGG